MKILILGATGPTGQLLVQQALNKFYQVTALVRNPAKFNLSNQNLTVIKGDVLDKTSFTKALKEQDAVLVALGTGASLQSSNLMLQAITHLIPAMQAAKVQRVILLSAFGVGATFAQANFIQKIIFSLPLKNIYADKAKANALLGNSALNWTIVCPVKLTNGPYTGFCNAAEKLPMKGMPKISRADVASFMLQQLTNDSFLQKTVVIKS